MKTGVRMWSRVVQLAVIAVAVGSLGLFTLALDLPADGLTQSQVKAKVLSLSNMPTGWSVDNSQSNGTSNLGGCLTKLQSLGKPAKGISRAVVHYVDQTEPTFDETLESGKGAVARYDKYLHILKDCKTISFTSGTTPISGTVGAMSFPTVGDSSSAFALTVGADGVDVTADFVLFRVGQIDGDIGYEDYSPDAATVQAFATEAIDKIEGKAATPPTTT